MLPRGVLKIEGRASKAERSHVMSKNSTAVEEERARALTLHSEGRAKTEARVWACVQIGGGPRAVSG